MLEDNNTDDRKHVWRIANECENDVLRAVRLVESRRKKKHDHERTNKQTNEQYHTITLYLSSPLHPQHNTTAISPQAKSPPNRIASDIPRPNLLKMLVTS